MLKRESAHMKVATVALLICLVLNSCATLLGGGTSQPVSISAQPTNGNYLIKSSSGLQMGSGAVPAQVRLPRRNEYQIEITADGYKTQSVVLTRGLNGWVWGNFVFGWIVGFLIDFVGGAAYKLEPAIVSVSLQTASLQSGVLGLFAVVTLRNERGQLIGERWLEMEPIAETPGALVTAP